MPWFILAKKTSLLYTMCSVRSVTQFRYKPQAINNKLTSILKLRVFNSKLKMKFRIF